jgi:hypothetical protein
VASYPCHGCERVLLVAIGIIVIAMMAFVIFMWWLVMLS